MTTEGDQQDDVGRRKFDDIASLFRPIVPPAGTPVRPLVPPVEAEPVAQEEPAPVVIETAPQRLPPRPTPARPETRPAPARAMPKRAVRAGAAARPEDVPWPDAFQPLPNYRRARASRSWSLLLLAPIGVVAALAVATVDMKTVREFVDARILHRPGTATSPGLDTALLPNAFRPGATPSPAAAPSTSPVPPAQEAPPPTAAAEPSAAATEPAVAAAPPAAEPSAPPSAPVTTPEPSTPAPAAQESAPAPASVASAVPIPPIPPTAAPTTAGLTGFVRIGINYRRSPAAENEARKLAAQLDGRAGAIEMHAGASAYRTPVIQYFNPVDKEAALALARTLTSEGGSWVVRAGPGRSPGTVEIWIP